MKFAVVTVVVLLASCSTESSRSLIEEKPIPVFELNRRSVIGELGLPLGTATEIQAEIIDGETLRLKAYQSYYLLKVTQVAGEKLSAPPTLMFSIPSFVDVQLASTHFELYRLKMGKEVVGGLGSDQLEKLEKGYVGKKVRLFVYEAGAFSGVPDKLPNDRFWWSDHGFQFESHLEVLEERK